MLDDTNCEFYQEKKGNSSGLLFSDPNGLQCFGSLLNMYTPLRVLILCVCVCVFTSASDSSLDYLDLLHHDSSSRVYQ